MKSFLHCSSLADCIVRVVHEEFLPLLEEVRQALNHQPIHRLIFEQFFLVSGLLFSHTFLKVLSRKPLFFFSGTLLQRQHFCMILQRFQLGLRLLHLLPGVGCGSNRLVVKNIRIFIFEFTFALPDVKLYIFYLRCKTCIWLIFWLRVLFRIGCGSWLSVLFRIGCVRSLRNWKMILFHLLLLMVFEGQWSIKKKLYKKP